MRNILTVFLKEVKDNFRDRRTMTSALIFGPLFGPLMFVAMLSLMLSRTVIEADEPLDLPVLGAENAPNLIEFLEQRDARILPAPADARAAVRDGIVDLVLVIPESFSENFSSGDPAPVRVVSDDSNSRTAKHLNRLMNLLRLYNATIASQRLQIRGISPVVVSPLAVQRTDVSTPEGRSVIVLGMMTYFVLFAMLLGGMYLAIDTTAGERERGSLEPLLTLPVDRRDLILGKIFATCFFMLLSLSITLFAFTATLGFIPLEGIGMAANFGPDIAIKVLLLMMPFSLVGAGLMTVVASFTKSYREAQSYLTVVLLVPTLPIIFASIYSLKPDNSLMAIPSLSQHLLVTSLMRAEPLRTDFVILSVSGTVAVGCALIWLAVRLYRREGLLV